MITKNETPDGTEVYFGPARVVIFTLQTSKEAIAKFVSLAELESEALTQLGTEYKEKQQWNWTNSPNGKNWPVFSKLERKLNELCKKAGIKDS